MGVIDWSREGERERAIVSSNVNRPRPLSCTQPFVFSHGDTAIVNIIVIVKPNPSTPLGIHIGVVYVHPHPPPPLTLPTFSLGHLQLQCSLTQSTKRREKDKTKNDIRQSQISLVPNGFQKMTSSKSALIWFPCSTSCQMRASEYTSHLRRGVRTVSSWIMSRLRPFQIQSFDKKA